MTTSNNVWLNLKRKIVQHRVRSDAMLSAASKIFAGILLAGLVVLGMRFLPRLRSNAIPAPLNLDQSGEAVPAPARIKIQALGIDAPIVNLGLNPDRTLAVPPGDQEVGWYVGSPPPSAIGPSVLVGHLDSARGPAVFQNLAQLKAGDVIQIVRADGITVSFKVDSSEKYSQSDFPTDKVYGRLDYPGLRLITCAGTYNKLRGHYSDNLVVYASLK